MTQRSWKTPLLLGSILFAICFLGCSRRQSVWGNYSGRFDWQNGLKSVTLVSETDGHHLDLGDTDMRRQVESIIGEQVRRANLPAAQGTVRVSVLGGPPFVMSVQQIQILTPDFAQMRSYVESENVDQIRSFVEQYHDVNQRDVDAQASALFYAAKEGHVSAARVLLSLGADANLPDSEGDTPLAAAIKGNSADVAQQLILAGADVNHADQAGVTPLMWAVWLGRPRLLTLLSQSKADPNYVSSDGRSALQIARDRQDQTSIAALRRAGASQ